MTSNADLLIVSSAHDRPSFIGSRAPDERGCSKTRNVIKSGVLSERSESKGVNDSFRPALYLHLEKLSLFAPRHASYERNDNEMHRPSKSFPVPLVRSVCHFNSEIAMAIDRDGRLINKDDEGQGISWNGRSVRVWKSMPQTKQY